MKGLAAACRDFLTIAAVSGVFFCSSLYAAIHLIEFDEAEGFVAGSPASGVMGWQTTRDSAVSIVGGESGKVGQYLEVTADEEAVSLIRNIHPEEWDNKKVAYWDFWIRPAADDSKEPLISIMADGAKLAFVKEGDHGTFAVFNATSGGSGESLFVKEMFAIDASNNRAEKWMRITIREDYALGRWDLYLNGRLALVDIAMDDRIPKPTAFEIYLSPGQKMSIDAWQLAANQPLFTDSDDDGMPDDYERAHGLDPLTATDRGFDADGDGFANIEEFRLGRSPRQAGPGAQVYVYVDNRIGSDANSGTLPYLADGEGPKASIKAAMAAAKDGDVIVVLPGTGLYQEGSRSARGKKLTIKPVGVVTIK